MTIPMPIATNSLVALPIAVSKTTTNPVCVPVPLSFPASTTTIYSLNVLALIQSNQIDQVQGLYVDNSNNPNVLQILISGTNQLINVPPDAQGTFPVLAGSTLTLTFTSDITGGSPGASSVFLLNVPVPLVLWGATSQSGFIFNSSGYGLVSDPVLDATVVGGKVTVSDPLLEACIAGSGTALNVVFGGLNGNPTSFSTLTGAVSATLVTAGAAKNYLMIQAPTGGDIWINPKGGTASVGGADCILVRAGTWWEKSANSDFMYTTAITYFSAAGSGLELTCLAS